MATNSLASCISLDEFSTSRDNSYSGIASRNFSHVLLAFVYSSCFLVLDTSILFARNHSLSIQSEHLMEM